MRRLLLALTAIAAGLASAPAVAGVGNFTIVNGTGSPISGVAIRRAGTVGWRPLQAAPPPGARAFISFTDPDCAFDIRASVAGTEVLWAGVNLCETKSLTLNRNAAGATWVDYD